MFCCLTFVRLIVALLMAVFGRIMNFGLKDGSIKEKLQ